MCLLDNLTGIVKVGDPVIWFWRFHIHWHLNICEKDQNNITVNLVGNAEIRYFQELSNCTEYTINNKNNYKYSMVVVLYKTGFTGY